MSEKKDSLLSITEYKALVPEGVNTKVYIKLVKDQLMSDKLTMEDFNLFLYVCKRTGLDPLTKQIHAVPYWSSAKGKYLMSIIAGIDGFRLVAQRTGVYAGQDDVIYDPVEEDSDLPKKATVGVHKIVGGQKVAFVASARWSEYVKLDQKGQPTGQWKTMPYLMLGKCAEALALRKAFPNELSGIYTSEEMDQVGIKTNVTGDLPTPERFRKDEVIVTSGQPTDMSDEPVQETTIPDTTPDFDKIKKQNKKKLESEDK